MNNFSIKLSDLQRYAKYRKYALPAGLMLLSIAMVIYQPKSQLQFKYNPQLEKESALALSSFSERIRAEQTKLEVTMVFVKGLAITRDPFATGKREVKSTQPTSGLAKVNRPAFGSFKLEGVWDSDNQKVAFINGVMLKVRDQISGYIVSQITARQVVLQGPQGTIVLKIEG